MSIDLPGGVEDELRSLAEKLGIKTRACCRSRLRRSTPLLPFRGIYFRERGSHRLLAAQRPPSRAAAHTETFQGRQEPQPGGGPEHGVG